jgi:hypothetical protein
MCFMDGIGHYTDLSTAALRPKDTPKRRCIRCGFACRAGGEELASKGVTQATLARLTRTLRGRDADWRGVHVEVIFWSVLSSFLATTATNSTQTKIGFLRVSSFTSEARRGRKCDVCHLFFWKITELSFLILYARLRGSLEIHFSSTNIYQCFTETKIWSWAPDECFTRRQTGRLTVGRNITLAWVERFVREPPAIKDLNSEAEVYLLWEPLPVNDRWKRSTLRTLVVCSSDL